MHGRQVMIQQQSQEKPHYLRGSRPKGDARYLISMRLSRTSSCTSGMNAGNMLDLANYSPARAQRVHRLAASVRSGRRHIRLALRRYIGQTHAQFEAEDSHLT
jgi:hypothetical protein